jgi:hypothetical protein
MAVAMKRSGRRATVKVWQAFLGVEAVLLVIGLIMPITPLKALVGFLVGNVMVALIVLIAVISMRRSKRKKPAD